MNILIASDSFKGSLSSEQVANAIEAGIRRVLPKANVKKIIMSDGGEGFAEAMLSTCCGERVSVLVQNPVCQTIESSYVVLEDKLTGVVEMAAASGLMLVPERMRNPLFATTFGTGELIKNALCSGVEKLIIGLGGSATNDGGIGMLMALGYEFFDKGGRKLSISASELEKVHTIKESEFMKRFKDVEFCIACDVTNPFCGPNGATAVFGPQKGANPMQIELLEKGMVHFAKKVFEFTNVDIKNLQGAGAAGGLGGALIAFLNGRLCRGIDVIIEASKFQEQAQNAHLIFTGEGRTDAQTLFGKVPVGVGRIAKKYDVPVVCLSGDIGDAVEPLFEEGITALFSITDKPMPLEFAIDNAEFLLSKSAENILRLTLKTEKARANGIRM